MILNQHGIAGLITPVPQTFVYKEVLGKQYKCIEIAPKVFWMCENLDYIDSNIIDSSDLSSDISVSASAYYNYDQSQSQGRFYTSSARMYLGTIKTPTMKNIDATYYGMLKTYLENLITNWLGYNVHPDETTLGLFVKGSDYDTYRQWLGLIDIGCVICGYYSNGWSKIPYGSSDPVYCGFTTGTYYNMIDVEQGYSLRYFTGDPGSSACYAVRFFIDEN